MWPDRVSNPGSLTYNSGALPAALHGLAGAFSFGELKRGIKKGIRRASYKVNLK